MAHPSRLAIAAVFQSQRYVKTGRALPLRVAAGGPLFHRRGVRVIVAYERFPP